MTTTIEQKDTALFLAHPGHIQRYVICVIIKGYAIICIFRLGLTMHNELNAIREKSIYDFHDGDDDEYHYHQRDH
ncbi:MAG: hypothetical protein ACM3X1_02925 [Ignavibacteriales bacterium]